jgi:hypothetical protein
MFYFVPIDGKDTNLRDSAVSTAMIADALRDFAARRIVLIVDACQAGGAIDVLSSISTIKYERLSETLMSAEAWGFILLPPHFR